MPPNRDYSSPIDPRLLCTRSVFRRRTSVAPAALGERETLDRIQGEIQADVDKAVQFAIDAPYPAPDKVDQDVYA